MATSENVEHQKIRKLRNYIYIIKMITKASPYRMLLKVIRKFVEGIYSVFFFVYLIQYIFDCLEKGTPFTSMFRTITIIAVGYLILNILIVLHDYYEIKDTPKIYKYIYSKVIQKAKEVPLNQFENPKHYDQYSRAIDNAQNRVNQVIFYTGDIVLNVAKVFLLAAMMIHWDPWILSFTIIPIINTMIVNHFRGKMYYARDYKTTKPERKAAYFKRIFYDKKYSSELRLYPIGEKLIKMHKDSCDEIADTQWYYNKRISYFELWGDFVAKVLIIILCIAYATYQILIVGRLSIGIYVSLMTSIKTIAFSYEMVYYWSFSLADECRHAENLKEFLEKNYGGMAEDACKKESIDDLQTLNLNDVSFQFEGSNQPFINHISLQMKRGEKIAFVGYNGAGKTTLVKLIMGLYKATSGDITYNGENINNFSKKTYIEKIATIFQDFQIYALSLADNIMMGSKINKNDEKRIELTLKKVGLDEKIRKYEKGIYSNVTREFDKDGINFSGGEAQKIAISRVFMKESADLLILDEPSSSLDPISEFNMYQDIKELSNDKTAIFISHRLSSARIADRIYFLENGTIAEVGSHDELMKMNGKYAHMFILQAQNYINDDLEVNTI